MPIWEYREDLQGYHRASFVNPNDIKRFLFNFLGKSLKDSWSSLPVQITKEQEKQSGDFFHLTGVVPVVSERAHQILLPLLGNDVEFLPLECDMGFLYILNVITVLSCLDHDESHFKYYTNGIIMDVTHYVFHEQCVSETPIFKIPEQLQRTYISETFKILIERENLNGLKLKPLP